ncbi:MAG: NAD-dependent epimerase/dehydratase family protein [Oscillospiraceae bacterium]|nr:NAD-dependent epimerase/dehydratase family protein [Oscillospiraceae bacterium]
MKKILITGADSYIGTSFENWVGQYPGEYAVETIDMIDGSWRERDFFGFDVVFHVAGIAHIKETKGNENLYYDVNRDLAVETARLAKDAGAAQFIFLSTMSVYGLGSGSITSDTNPNPKNHYGKLKLEAEKLIQALDDETFKTAIIRPPMVYGKDCKGNYAALSRMAKKMPMFPRIDNKRSMIYIDNLCEFVRLLIEKSNGGLFLPQNNEYVCTSLKRVYC